MAATETIVPKILPYMGEGRGDHFDRHQFIKPARAVKARYTREGWETTGIAFSEVKTSSGGNIHVDHRVVATHRRNPTQHEWAMNDASVQKVVLNYCEARLYLRGGDKLTVEQRLCRIDKASADAVPYKRVLLRDAMEQYTLAEKDHAPKEELRRRKIIVENFDSEIMILRRGVVKLATLVVYHSYRLGRNSVQVAEELGVRPQAVRVFLYRLNRRAVGLSSSLHRDWRKKYKHLPRRRETRPVLGKLVGPRPRRAWTSERLKQFEALRATGLSFNQCAKRLGTGTSYAIKIWRKNFDDLNVRSAI